MTWLRDGIDRLVSLSSRKIVKSDDGTEYWDVDGMAVRPPRLDPYPKIANVGSLYALLSALYAEIGGLEHVPKQIVVTSHKTVEIVSHSLPPREDRLTFISASYENEGFAFNRYHDLESFIIGVQCQFVDSQAKEDLLAFVSGITGEEVVNNTDDGISQTVAVKVGFRKETTTRNPIVMLRPFRTFTEVEQPLSRFLLRIQKGREAPQIALFEADGGQWKSEASANVAEFLRGCSVVQKLRLNVIG